MMSQRLGLALLLGSITFWFWGCGKEESNSPQATSDSGASHAPLTSHPGGRLPDKSLSTPQRQVILDAELTLVVTEIQHANQQVSTLVQQHTALVTRSEMGGYAGRTRDCDWTIRVPPAQYDGLLTAIAGLGEITHRVESSRDVTAEAVDLDARIRNKTQEESRLLQHLESSTGNLQEILLVEKEISRVREELERMQGQRTLLKDQVDWATITLRITQRHGVAVAAPIRFVDQVSRVWHESWHALVTVLRFVSLCLLALLPWLVTLVLPIVVLWKVVQHRRTAKHHPTGLVD